MFQTNLKSLSNIKSIESFGFKLSGGGAHISRTMMLKEITKLLKALPASATIEEYRKATIEENLLGKATQSNRKETFRRLRELYSLSDKVPILGIFRQLFSFDPQSIPLLSLLVAWARDPILRATTPAVFAAAIETRVNSEILQQALTDTYPNTFSLSNNAKIARNAASTWTQSGHLRGHSKKIRCRVQPGPAALTLALIMAYVCDFRGEMAFSSPFCQLLDLNTNEARLLAAQAHREELITLKAVGSIVDISFPRFNQFLQGVE